MPQQIGSYRNKPGYKKVGAWEFDRDRLWAKIDTKPDQNGCHNAKSAWSPSGALMGAWKNGVQQMTQIRRLVLMDVTNEDISEHRITLSCGNQRCCNYKEHFVLKPNKRRTTL
jgi:hypothetical protein